MDMIESQPEIVRKIMSKMIITDARSIYHSQCIEYTAISERLFDYVRLGEIIPKYKVICEKSGDYVKIYTEKEVND
jgi:glutamate synthase domain-containing protein 2